MGIGVRLEIDVEKAERILARSLDAPRTHMTLREFIRTHFEAIAAPGKTIKAVYESLTEGGVDVGSYAVFSNACSQIKKTKREREEKNFSETSPLDAKTAMRVTREQKRVQAGTEGKIGSEKRKRNPALPSVYLPDGTEVEITKTGAKVFQIEHSEDWKEKFAMERSNTREANK
jgi:hypothetical protein